MIEAIPQAVLDILNQLEKKGFLAYLVGGCVRDLLLQKTPKDWDICTSALPWEIKQIFPNPLTLGEKYGTIGIKTEVGIVEITTFRSEKNYQDFRHPQVEFVSSLKEDLKRRDFTINAMAIDCKREIIDLFCGKEDLQNKTLRCVGNASKRFFEDSLRILRLIRFSCTLGFIPTQETLNEAKKHKHLLKKIATERIRDELILIFQGDYFHHFFSLYKEIFHLFLPNLKQPKQYKIKNTALLFAFLLNQEEDYKILENLKFSNTIKTRVKILLRYKFLKIPAEKIALKTILKEIGYDHLMALLELKKLNGEDTKKLFNLLQDIMIYNECFSLKDLQIKGDELKQLGFEKQEIGETLEKLLLEVIKGSPNTQENLRSLAVTFLSYKKEHLNQEKKVPYDQNPSYNS